MTPGENGDHLMAWARQTIVSAFTVKGFELGKPLDCEQKAELAGIEGLAMAQDLWELALLDCGSEAAPSRRAIYFQKRVLDWAAKHRSPGYRAPQLAENDAG